MGQHIETVDKNESERETVTHGRLMSDDCGSGWCGERAVCSVEKPEEGPRDRQTSPCERENETTQLRDVAERVARAVDTLDVLLLEQSVDRLLDVRDLGREPLRDLGNDLLDQRLVLHRLARLHDTAQQCQPHANRRTRYGNERTERSLPGSRTCGPRRQS